MAFEERMREKVEESLKQRARDQFDAEKGEGSFDKLSPGQQKEVIEIFKKKKGTPDIEPELKERREELKDILISPDGTAIAARKLKIKNAAKKRRV
jgi:hypothetical protein